MHSRGVQPMMPTRRRLLLAAKLALVVAALAPRGVEGFSAPSRSSGGAVAGGIDGLSPEEKQPSPPSSGSGSIRPLQRNWWPVALVSSLESDRPNGVELLGRKLVLWKAAADGQDDETGGWSCLDDACSHRFAPLSEGRLLHTNAGDEDEDDEKAAATTTRLQCAYHGWEFSSVGACGRVPQADGDDSNNPLSRGQCDVPSYPVRLTAGMVWVWADPSPSTADLAASVPLPVSPLVERLVDRLGPAIGFQRDLPYGAELLGENLLDLSHLPFSHHGVGNLNREGEDKRMPLRMLSGKEKIDHAQWERDYREITGGAAESVPIPMFQAEVVDAAVRDPTFVGMTSAGMPVADDAECTISFHEPCHARYRRKADGKSGDLPATHVELFFCPTSAGKSRVFLYNVFESMLPPVESAIKGSKKEGTPATIRPPAPKSSLRKRLANRVKGVFKGKVTYDEMVVFSHTICHKIFDGDGIFLHKQGDRMERSAYSYRDYSTPASSDVLVNAYRRYLDAAAKGAIDTGGLGGMAAAHAATGGAWCAAEDGRSQNFDFADVVQTVEGGLRRVPPGAYTDSENRSVLLDRYRSHTEKCEACSAALAHLDRTSGRLESLRVGLVGASGACAMGTIAAAGAAVSGAAAPLVLVGGTAASLCGTVLGARWAKRAQDNVEEMTRQFKFEDYVHADKN